MKAIDRTSPVPIYHQLRTLIETRIKKGLLRPGDRIPTERELCQAYGISRSPVRQALNELAHEGLLIRRPGLGTFVAKHVCDEASTETVIRMMCSDPNWSGVLNHVSHLWNEKYPGRTIRIDVDVVPHTDFYDLLRAEVGSGTAPDLAMIDSVWVAGLAHAGFLYALEELGLANQPDWGGDAYPAFVHANSFDGRLYGFPLEANASLLWYRRDWLVEESLPVPHDWDTWLDVAVHFLQPEVRERYGLHHPLAFPGGTAGGEATVYSLLPFIWTAGGEIIDPEARCIVLDSPKTSRALQFLRDLVHRHGVSSRDLINYGHNASPKLFAEGKVAMALGGSHEAKLIQAVSQWSDVDFCQRVGATPPPAPPGRDRVSTVGGTSCVVLRQCSRPVLAKDVLELATNRRVTGNLYDSISRKDPRPALATALGPDRGPLLPQVSTMITAGRARPSIPEYVQISRQLGIMFEEVMYGEKSIADIMRETARFISVVSDLPCQAMKR